MQDTNFIGRAKRTSQQTVGMQLLDPLAVQDIRLAAGDVHNVTSIDQLYFEPTSLEQFEQRDPVFVAEGKLDQAIPDYGEAIEIAPQFADAYANRGLALLRRGRTSEARWNFEQSLRLDPSLKTTLEERINQVSEPKRQET